jgi:hypothetical protein
MSLLQVVVHAIAAVRAARVRRLRRLAKRVLVGKQVVMLELSCCAVVAQLRKTEQELCTSQMK